ncbi:MAG: hypothetical protein ACI8Y7_001063 [Candidatus Woesearchaeota archaeon]|jgi:hypothetical protein
MVQEAFVSAGAIGETAAVTATVGASSGMSMWIIIVVAVVILGSVGGVYVYVAIGSDDALNPDQVGVGSSGSDLDELGAAIDASNAQVAATNDFYCEHKGPTKLHYTSVSRYNFTADVISYEEVWMKVDANDELSYMIKSYSQLFLYGIQVVEVTYSYSTPGETQFIFSNANGDATCQTGYKVSDSPAVSDIVHLKSLGKAYDYGDDAQLKHFDDFETRTINGFSCQYGEFGPGFFSCFSKDHCAVVFEGADFHSQVSFTDDGATITQDDTTIDVSVGLLGNAPDTSYTVDITGSSSVIDFSYDDFSDSIFELDLDTSKCASSEDYSRIVDKYDSLTDPALSIELETLSNGELTAEDYSIDDSAFISRGEAAIAQILAES